jgi:hypothetical protein
MDNDLSDDDPTVEEELLDDDLDRDQPDSVEIVTDLPATTRFGDLSDIRAEDTVDDLKRIETSSPVSDGMNKSEQGYDPYDSTPKRGK